MQRTIDRPSLGEIAWVMARNVNGTFGGGFPAMELLRRSGIRRGWLDTAGHGLLIAVSRLTPGTNLFAYCAALGWTWRRLAGAITALLAASVPCAMLVTLLAATLATIEGRPAVQLVLAAATIVASVLVFMSAWHLLRPYLTGRQRTRALVVVAIALALSLLGATPVRVLLAVAIWGAIVSPKEPGRAIESAESA